MYQEGQAGNLSSALQGLAAAQFANQPIRKEPQVSRELLSLEKQIAALGASLDILFGKLDSVSRPLPPAGGLAGCEKDGDVQCPMSLTLSKMREALATLTMRVSDQCSRIEL